MNKICETCAAWKCDPQGRNNNGVFEGDCRRRSPKAILYREGDIRTVFPIIYANQWCGEWEALDETQAKERDASEREEMKCPNCENEIDAWAIVEEEKIAFMRNLIRAGQRRREEAEARGETLPTALEICYSIMNAPNPMWETIERLRKEEEPKEEGK